MSAAANRRARLAAHGIPSPDYCVTRHGSQWRVKVDFDGHVVQQYYSSRDDALAARDSIVQAIIDTGDISNFRSWKPFPPTPPSKKEQRWNTLRNQITSEGDTSMKRPALHYFQPLKIYRELDILPLLFDFRAERAPDDDTLCDAIDRLSDDYNAWLTTDDSAEAVLTQIIKSYPSYWDSFVEYASRRHDLDIAEEFIRNDLCESDCTVSSSVHSLWICEEDGYRQACSDRLPEYRPESIRDGEWPLHAAFASESDAITYFEAVLDGRKD